MRPGPGSARDPERPEVIQLNKPKPEPKPEVSTAGVLQNGVPVYMAQVPQVTLERLGTQEEQAQRAKLARDLMVQQQAAQRQLASQQARAGIRGPAAVAQQARLSQQVAQQRAVQEEEGALQRRLFNLEQAQKEQFANVASQLALKQMASSLEGQKAIAQAAKEGAQIQASAAKDQGGGCCFIFLEADNGVLNRIARRARDELLTDRNRRGYYKLAEVLVPLMRKYSVFKFLIKWTMVKPMICAGKWKYGENKIGRLFVPVAYFWLGIYDYLGGDHPFLRDNGEIV